MSAYSKVHKDDWWQAMNGGTFYNAPLPAVMTKSRRTGVSRHVNVAGPGFRPGASSSSGKTQRFSIAKIAEEKVKVTQRYKNFTAGTRLMAVSFVVLTKCLSSQVLAKRT